MKIGIISDTHDLLRPEVLAALQGCNHILHGGDISSPRILERLRQIAPVIAVRGNNDREWAENLPQTLDFTLCGLHICMAHKRKDLPGNLAGFDVAVYGHSHQYGSGWVDHTDGSRTLMLNPGSCGPRRFYQPITLSLLTIREDGWQADRVDIANTVEKPAPIRNSGDLRQLIEEVVRETQRGRTVSAIAARTGLDAGLVEQIVRLYVTHPGVTADGIMTKMGL